MSGELSEKVLKAAFKGMFKEFGYDKPEVFIEAIEGFVDDHVTNEEDYDRLLSMLFAYTAMLLTLLDE